MLTGNEIVEQIAKGDTIIFERLWPWNVGPNSIDLHIGPHVAKFLKTWERIAPEFLGVVKVDDTAEIKQMYRLDDYSEQGYFEIGPGEQMLCHTLECFGALKDYVPQIATRSTAKRLGLDVCMSAGFGDVGYVNKWTLEVFNASPFTLMVPVGARIAQVFFSKLEGEQFDVYTGSYQGSISPPYDKDWKPSDMLPKALDTGKGYGSDIIVNDDGETYLDLVLPEDPDVIASLKIAFEALNYGGKDPSDVQIIDTVGKVDPSNFEIMDMLGKVHAAYSPIAQHALEIESDENHNPNECPKCIVQSDRFNDFVRRNI